MGTGTAETQNVAVSSRDVLELLEDDGDGLTVDEIADELDADPRKVYTRVGILDKQLRIYPDEVGDREDVRWRVTPNLPGRVAR